MLMVCEKTATRGAKGARERAFTWAAVILVRRRSEVAADSYERAAPCWPRPFRKSAQFAFIATAAGDEFSPYRR